MNVVALVSGGKDSTFNMIRCVQEGHQIVCMLNLHPPASQHELDSYMYQSVGSEVLEDYAVCMQIPLIRVPIKGTPKCISLEYVDDDCNQSDEVEDLFMALRDHVLPQFPQVQAVSSGAIWSTYQFNRVQRICDRLGLISLAYLWQREQKGLLNEMLMAGVNAVLIKVAVSGLGDMDLGKSLACIHDKLIDLSQGPAGLNVCGEGGEYESLTLDCPLFIKEKLVLDMDKVSRVIHRDDPFAPVIYLTFNQPGAIKRVSKMINA